MDRRQLRLLLGLVLSTGFLAVILRHLDLPRLGAMLAEVTAGPLMMALVLLAADYFLRVTRWWLMLRVIDGEVRLRECGWPFLVSFALNNVVPFRAGDLVRVVGFRRHLRAPAMARAGTLVIERLLDLLVLLVFFFLGLIWIGPDGFPQRFIVASVLLAAGGVGGLVVLLLFPGRLLQMVMLLLTHRRWVEHPMVRRLQGWARQFFQVLSLLRSSTLTLQLVGLSFLAWSLEGLVFLSVASAIPDHVPFDGAWMALSAGTLATLIPSSPGYVGTFDFFAMKAAMAAGVAPEPATAFAFLVHFVLWLPVTLVGVLYFVAPGGRALWRAARQTEAGGTA